MSNSKSKERQGYKDIVSSVANDYYESLRNEAPYINMTFEKLGAVCRDFATADVDAILTAHTNRAVVEARLEEVIGARENWHGTDDDQFARLMNQRMSKLESELQNLTREAEV